MYQSLNSGKISVRLNLKDEQDLSQIKALIRSADVLVESFRPGVLARLGLSPKSLLQLNPKLIIVSLTGYGQHGPLHDQPGHDINYAAVAGLASISGGDSGDPSYDIGLPVTDIAGSMFTLTAVLGGLLNRQKTGFGEHLDVAITDSVLHWMTARVGARYHASNLNAEEFRRHLHTRPGYGFYQTECGGWVALGALETLFWKRLVVAMGLDDLSGVVFDDFEYRCEQSKVIDEALVARFATHDRDYWLMKLNTADVPLHSS